MYNLKNENGMALVTVLLIITIFMILFLAFAGQSFTTVKQNQVIEKNSQSVALAEMGVSYFEKSIQNVYNANINEVINEVNAIRKQHIDSGAPLNNEYYIETARDKMFTKISCALDPSCSSIQKIELTQSIKDKANSTFLIKSKVDGTNLVLADENNKEIISDFISIGDENGEETVIGASLIMDFSDVLPGNTIEDPGNSLPVCDNTQVNFTNTECQFQLSKTYTNSDKLLFNNSTLKVNGDLSFGNLNNENVESTLYIDGNMNAGNMNSFETLYLHVTGDANFGQFTGEGLTDSIIEIGGNANFNNIKLTNSNLYIEGPKVGVPYLGKILDMVQSSIFVNSGAKFESISMANDSTICVNGPLTISDSAQIVGTVYAKSSTHSNVITDPTLFENVCTKLAWGSATFTADYDYNYQ